MPADAPSLIPSALTSSAGSPIPASRRFRGCWLLEQLGVRPDPLLPWRLASSESAVHRLLARLDADALDRAVGRGDQSSPLPCRRAARSCPAVGRGAPGFGAAAAEGSSYRGV